MDSASVFEVRNPLLSSHRLIEFLRVEARKMGEARTVETAGKGTNHADLLGALIASDRLAGYANRVMNCISRAFRGMGASPEMQDILFWKLQMTRNIGVREIVNNPEEFIEGMKVVYGQAGTAVFEHMLAREIRREFGLQSAMDGEQIKKIGVCDLLRLLEYAALESRTKR